MQNSSITVVCPLYNGRKYVEYLNTEINKQININIIDVLYIITKTNDGTEEYLESIGAKYKSIDKDDFSYSLTRELILKEWVTTEKVIMISQDIKFVNNEVFSHLVKAIDTEGVAYAFSRQIADNNSIEKYIRKNNYPMESYCISSNDIQRLGLKAFFASDVCCIINRDVFIKLNGYDQQNIPMNQEMYYSKKLLENGYKIMYCADSKIIHYHNYTLKELDKRYFLVGQFFAQYPEFKKYKAESTGLKLAFKVFFSALFDFNLPVVFRAFPDMLTRYMAKRRGEKSINEKQ